MAKITLETRRMAYEEILQKLSPRYSAILKELKQAPMTARELAIALWSKGVIPSPERNFVHPRLTELEDAGMVEAVGKKRCSVTRKMVAVYALADQEAKQGELDL
jgi:hypothetical protein